MTAAQTKTLRTLLITVGGPLIVALCTWGATHYNQSKLDTLRFTNDSARRDQKYAIDSAGRSSDHEVLMRIDNRVREIYCDKKPPGCQ